MKSIKLFAWGSAFADRIHHIRNDSELIALRKIGALQAVSSFIGSATPFLMACSDFAVCVLVQRKPLTTEIVFPAVALFQPLTSPLTILPAAISSVTGASVVGGHLEAFFTTDEAYMSIHDASFKRSMHEPGTVSETSIFPSARENYAVSLAASEPENLPSSTNSTPALLEANAIVLVHDGKISELGTYHQLKAKGGDIVSLIAQAKIVTGQTTTCAEEGIVNGHRQSGDLEASKATGVLIPRRNSAVQGSASIPGRVDPGSKILGVEAAISKPKRRKELAQQGCVKWKGLRWVRQGKQSPRCGLVRDYARGNVWLKRWSEANDDPASDVDVKKDLGIYVAFGLGSASLVILQSSTLWLWALGD
ncbi:hypothetical protein ACJ41O_008736 [Fusarium nematophilum]